MPWSILYIMVVFPLLLVVFLALDLVEPTMKSVQSPELRYRRRSHHPSLSK